MMNNKADINILICDDEINILESICYVVKKEGFSYITASDGFSAYELACSEKPDLVILDVGMPGMTGYDVCTKLRETPGCEKMKVLILTAHGQSSDRDKAYEAGTEYFMTKPFSPRELRSKLNQLILE